MTLPSGAYCVIRSKHVCCSQDEPSYVRGVDDGSKPIFCDAHHPQAQQVFRKSRPPLKPRDHHWLTLRVQFWHSEDEFKSGKPSVLTTDVQFGQNFCQRADLIPWIIAKFEEHFSTERGDATEARWHKDNAVEDLLGLLNHPHVQALEVTV